MRLAWTREHATHMTKAHVSRVSNYTLPVQTTVNVVTDVLDLLIWIFKKSYYPD